MTTPSMTIADKLDEALADMAEAIEAAQKLAAMGHYALAASQLYEAGNHARAAKSADLARKANQ